MNAYDALMVGQAAFSGYQSFSYTDHTLDLQANMNPNDPTAPLSAQESALRKQAQLASQQAALDAGKGAAYLALWQQIPTAEDALKKCEEDARRSITARPEVFAEYYEEFKQLIERSFPQQVGNQRCIAFTGTDAQVALQWPPLQGRRNVALTARAICQETFGGSCTIMNGEARDKMLAAGIAAGIEGMVNMGKAALLNRQANKIGGLIDDIEAFEPTPLGYEQDDFFGSPCELDPLSPECAGHVSSRSYDFDAGGPLQIHGLQHATTFERGDVNDPTVSDQGSASTTNRSNVARPVGTFDDAPRGSGGFADRIPGAADVRSGGAAGGGAGGGGGPGSAGGAPQATGGGGGGDAPRMANPRTNAIANSYQGGGGSLRFGGGSGAQGRGPSSEPENPFSNLFGQNGPGNGDLNFRDTASDEGIAGEDVSIFKIITNRYSAVQQSDRLLRYERSGD